MKENKEIIKPVPKPEPEYTETPPPDVVKEEEPPKPTELPPEIQPF